jgi:hypothetical protein
MEVGFSRRMVGVYRALGTVLLAYGLVLIGIAMGVVSPGTGTAKGSDAEGVHVQGKCVPWSVISGFGTTLQGNAWDTSHLVTTILVDESTVDAWAAQRKSAGARRSRLYAPGVIGSEGICLPHNLAVNPVPLSEALEAIRADVTTRTLGGSNPRSRSAPVRTSSTPPCSHPRPDGSSSAGAATAGSPCTLPSRRSSSTPSARCSSSC